jgi:hypothetical protein
MTNTKERKACSFILWYAPGSVVGPKEFDHALECDDCWKAMARWMDAEVVTIPDLEERAKRLAGAEEVIAAMVTDDAASERARLAAAAVKLVDDRTTLTDVLSGRNEAALVRGPWKPRRKRTPKPKEEPCDTKATECSPSPAGECPVLPINETDDAVEDECRRRHRLLAGRWESDAAAAAPAPAVAISANEELALQRAPNARNVPARTVRYMPESVCAGGRALTHSGKQFCMACVEEFGSCPLMPSTNSNKPIPAAFIDLEALEEVPGEFTH